MSDYPDYLEVEIVGFNDSGITTDLTDPNIKPFLCVDVSARDFKKYGTYATNKSFSAGHALWDYMQYNIRYIKIISDDNMENLFCLFMFGDSAIVFGKLNDDCDLAQKIRSIRNISQI